MVGPIRNILDRPGSAHVIGPRRILRQGERRRGHQSRGRNRDCAFAYKGAREQDHLYLRTKPVVCARGFSATLLCAPRCFLKDRPKKLPTRTTSGALLNMAAWNHILN